MIAVIAEHTLGIISAAFAAPFAISMALDRWRSR